MIEVMQRLANRVYPVRFLFVIIAFLSLFAFLYVALSGDHSLEPYLFPSIITFGWCVCLFGISDVFNKVPDNVEEGDGFFVRLRKRIQRLIAWVWSVGFLLCTVLLFYLSFKTFGLAFAAS